MKEKYTIDYIPSEKFFVQSLQSHLTFQLGKKIVKQGRLLLFKRAHFHLVLTMLNSRNNKESFEIPLPFKIEYYPEDKTVYFDYRVTSLAGNNKEFEDRFNNVKVKDASPSQYLNKILEIVVK
jgi:hypothetical protein